MDGMCTLSWFPTSAGYELFFNRDERRSRGPARPPTLRAGSPRIVAPTDADAGGSWIAVNDRGLTVCLLNGYQSGDRTGTFVSRGQIVLELARQRDVAAALAVLERQEVRRLRSFQILAIDPHEQGTRTWDGERLGPVESPSADEVVVSSSFLWVEVCRSRRETFRQIVDGKHRAAVHRRAHASHLPERGPSSICMHREDARTVSFSHVVVDREAVRFSYLDDAPCRASTPTTTLRMTRVS